MTYEVTDWRKTGMSGLLVVLVMIGGGAYAGAADVMAVEASSDAAGEREAVLVPAGSVWKYWYGASGASASWNRLGFDDSSWREGAAELGAGDGDEVTVLDPPPWIYFPVSTVYFRHSWVVPDPSIYISLVAGLRRDDGGVVYLNGEEVFRSNMPEGRIGSSSFAWGKTESETEFYEMEVDAALLLAGENLLAVEVHQEYTSSDVSFDLELRGVVRPDLAITRVGDGVSVSWPGRATGYVLHGSVDPLSAVWDRVEAPVELVDDRHVVVLSATGFGQFYRLDRVKFLQVLSLPQSATVYPGEDVTFEASAEGNDPLSYQWSLNGVEIAGATTGRLDLTAVQLEDAGTYALRIEDAAGQVKEVMASLVVLVPPTILVQPEDVTVNAGEDATFSVTVTGTVPMGYKWRRNATAVKIETDSPLLTSSVTLSNVTADLDGHQITVILTNAAYWMPGVISRRAILTVNP